MFKIIRQRFDDARTLKTLCFEAERMANERGQREPGAEHFVLAALDLPDGTARETFERIECNPDGFSGAIEAQYRRALQVLGLDMESADHLNGSEVPVPTAKGPYRAQPSVASLMQVLTRDIMVEAQRRDATMPLLGAHVLIAAASAQFGVCARAFQELGIEPPRLVAAAHEAIAHAHGKWKIDPIYFRKWI